MGELILGSPQPGSVRWGVTLYYTEAVCSGRAVPDVDLGIPTRWAYSVSILKIIEPEAVTLVGDGRLCV
jgi:hypothetical protein